VTVLSYIFAPRSPKCSPPFRFSTKILYALRIYPTCNTRLPHLILLKLITVNIWQRNKLRSSYVSSFPGSSYNLPLGFKCSSQHPAFKLLQSLPIPLSEKPNKYKSSNIDRVRWQVLVNIVLDLQLNTRRPSPSVLGFFCILQFKCNFSVSFDVENVLYEGTSRLSRK
jgi:hypothetical protein